jgi:hypothetical protein
MAELATKADLLAMEQALQTEARNSFAELHKTMNTLVRQLTIRFAVMMVVFDAIVIILWHK